MRNDIQMAAIALTVLALGATSGCSLTPPKPAQCEGDFHPINSSAQQIGALGGTLGGSLSQADSLALCTGRRTYGKQG